MKRSALQVTKTPAQACGHCLGAAAGGLLVQEQPRDVRYGHCGIVKNCYCTFLAQRKLAVRPIWSFESGCKVDP